MHVSACKFVGLVSDSAGLQLRSTQCRGVHYAAHEAIVPKLQAIVTAIRNNNPGRAIPASAVRGFPSRDAANAYEAANPETVTGGLFFSRLAGGNIGFVLQSNSTVGSPPQGCAGAVCVQISSNT